MELFNVSIVYLHKYLHMSKEKGSESFYCESCNYHTTRRSQYNRHILTLKHKHCLQSKPCTENTKEQPIQSLINTNKEYICSCGKSYKHRQSLYNHTQQCEDNYNKYHNNKNMIVNTNESGKQPKEKTIEPSEELDYKAMFLTMVEKNNELQQTLVDIVPKIGNQTNSNNTNTFNIQIFLNEKCKNAMPLMEFVDKLQLQLTDLTSTAEKGYVESMSDIFIRELEGMDVTERPIHCSDIARDTLYVKNHNNWTQDDRGQTLMNNAIDKVRHENFSQLEEWIKEHPNYQDKTHTDNKEYLEIVTNCLEGSNGKSNKLVVKNIAKEVRIQKK